MPSSSARVSDITITAAAPSFNGHAFPAVTSPSGRNTGFSSASFSTVVPSRGPSSLRHTAVGQRQGDDLTLEEAVVLRLDRELLRTGARTRPSPGGPRSPPAARSRPSAPWRCRCPAARTAAPTTTRRSCAPASAPPRRERRVVRPRVGRAELEPRHGLDARAHERIAFAGLHRVRRHADALQRRRAVPVHGHARNVGHSGEDRGDPGDVVARLTAGLAAPGDEVVDRLRIELRHLLERRLHDRGGQIVGTAIDE